MPIPKVIHYCWFGGNKLPKSAEKCINSWRKLCPDYEIKQWDESNYDVTQNNYMLQAYNAKKWAFVSDFARLDIIYRYGGIYFDVDVEVIKPIDDLLENEAFFARQTYGDVASGLGFGAQKGNPAVKKLMEEYSDIDFIKSDGTYDLTPCPKRNVKALLSLGLDLTNNSVQKLCNSTVTVFPEEYFCPMHAITRELKLTKNTYTIHHFDASWQSGSKRLKNKLRNILGPKLSIRIINFKRKLAGKSAIEK